MNLASAHAGVERQSSWMVHQQAQTTFLQLLLPFPLLCREKNQPHVCNSCVQWFCMYYQWSCTLGAANALPCAAVAMCCRVLQTAVQPLTWMSCPVPWHMVHVEGDVPDLTPLPLHVLQPNDGEQRHHT